ncbi:MAG TPA: CRISPR-associated endonuclease Cas6 [Chitinophagaceae bacterium]|nr:CRISPR-associated endonuclease Cas6 [Chitinophagaceae bacterium]
MKIRRLTIQFNHPTNLQGVSAFRGAIASKIGKEHSWFHQHLTDGNLAYRYPLIQYKSINSFSSIVCLSHAVDEIHNLFNQDNWEINIKGKKVALEIENLDLGNVTLQVKENSYQYVIKNWLALNDKNYKRYKEYSDIDQLDMLEKILIGNILAFAKGVDWEIDKEVKLRILNIIKVKSLRYKNTQLMAFDVDFSTNAFLPNFIGLGKGVSHGYGVINHKKNTNR